MNKLNTITIVMFGAGVILLYAGIKDVNPKDVVTLSLAGKSPSTASTASTTSGGTSPSVNTHPAKPDNNGTVTNV